MTLSSLPLGWQQPRPGQVRPLPILHDGEGHLVTVAPTGAGKGVSCIIPALLTYPGPVIVIDPKGENYAVTARRRREMGQAVHVLDPFFVTDADTRDALDPLDLVAVKTPSEADDAAVVARLLVQGQTSHKEPYWDERAETLIIGLILHVLHHSPTPHRSLAEVRHHINVNPANVRQSDFLVPGQVKHAEILAAQSLFTCGMHEKTAGCIVSVAAQHTAFLRTGPVQASICRSTVKLDDIEAGKPMTIYLVLPPDKLASHGKLLRLWLGVMMAALSRRRTRPKLATLLIVDEAAQLGPLNELRTAVTLMRGYGVKVWSFWQDLSQLIRTYPLDWKSLMNNCAVQTYLRPMSPSAAAEIDEYLMHSAPKPAAHLKDSEAILVRAGDQPTIMRRANYLTDALFAGRADPNPFHPAEPKQEAAERPEGNVIVFPHWGSS